METDEDELDFRLHLMRNRTETRAKRRYNTLYLCWLLAEVTRDTLPLDCARNIARFLMDVGRALSRTRSAVMSALNNCEWGGLLNPKRVRQCIQSIPRQQLLALYNRPATLRIVQTRHISVSITDQFPDDNEPPRSTEVSVYIGEALIYTVNL
jgi:hypothetical protein